MKVFYVSNLYDGCYYVRCLLPLVAAGWDGTKTSLMQQPISREKEFEACMDADVLVFQRPMDDQRAQTFKLFADAKKKYNELKAQGITDPKLERLANKVIVFENDDTFKTDEMQQGMKVLADGNTEYETLKYINKNIDESVRNADLVTTTTEFLKKEYEKLNKNVVVLPNCVEPLDWEDPLKNDGDKVRIGLVGSVASSEDFKEIEGIIPELMKDDRIELVLFSLPADDEKLSMLRKVFKEEIAFWEQFNPEWHHYVPHHEYNDKLNELRLDLMLIPRKDNYFNRCKSNLKFLEASMLEIPVIAQGFTTGDSPYQGEEDSKYMEICIDREEWLPAINDLVKNREKRQAMGKKAREYVLEKYDINNNIHLWEQSYANSRN